MLHDIALALWFFLPAGFANMAPVLVAAVPGLRQWNTPIDGGRTLFGQPLLGSHKTWRGLIAGILFATLIFYLQQLATASFDWAKWLAGSIDYPALPTLLMGILFAVGALGGDAAESFWKRRRGLQSGEPWLFFDQLDYVLGAMLLTALVIRLSWTEYVWAVIVWFSLHVITSYAGWLAGLKERPI